jgi:hypothetical protein
VTWNYSKKEKNQTQFNSIKMMNNNSNTNMQHYFTTPMHFNDSDLLTEEHHIPVNYPNILWSEITFAWESFSSLPLDGRGESAAANN